MKVHAVAGLHRSARLTVEVVPLRLPGVFVRTFFWVIVGTLECSLNVIQSILRF